ncbi:MAG TPA: hypothetical protein ENN29_02935 [Candidatus Hydrogenedentes bacterium]|nr:hypothetical protein [Candidatus Hydrogenedentota bacterium]
MSQDENGLREKDPTRLCPVCRMPISILAVRCRFCGAEVGRPRKEQETFTVKDLGGEQRSTYTVSGNVTEALEAFISEERAQIETKKRERQAAARKSFLRRSKPDNTSAPATPPGVVLPELDETSRALSSSAMASTRSRTARVAQGSPLEIVGRKTLIVAGIVAGLILLYFGTDFAWARIRNLLNSSSVEGEFVYPNRAEEFYASGRPLVEVLEESLTALRYNDTPENREIADKMRRRFLEDVEKNAFAKPFDMYKLNEASRQINRAGQVDSNSATISLMDEINREVGYFKFVLTRVDDNYENATFRLNNPFLQEKEETVSVGDMLQGRFLVKSITPREVLLEDASPKGDGRQLLAKRMEAVIAFK